MDLVESLRMALEKRKKSSLQENNELSVAFSKFNDEIAPFLTSCTSPDFSSNEIVAFNYTAVHNHILKCANHHKRTDDESLNDMLEIVLIGLRHGNVREDQLAWIAYSGAQRIKQLANWYKIHIRSYASERIQMQEDTLTFVRAITYFPFLASLILYKKVGLATNGATSVLASEQLPDAMKHAGFSGLIPKCCDLYLMKAYLFAHAAYMVDFGKLIRPNANESLKAMAIRQLRFCKNAVENEKSPYSDEFRVGYLREVGLTDAADVFKKIVNVCNNLCKVVGEPELTLEAAEKYHIKNNMVCFFDDHSTDIVSADENENPSVVGVHDPSTSMT
ncbi:hypothetical protein QVD17_10695 [Tagetes erecta]|uniref:Nucleocapsid protein n=1 Tax=Tagetes erecta TaxID=13708 RepID=A0AAD8L6A3_TARER|nr:hypothetical protein QVD17_10695 [Tagetes erecta]